MLNIILIVVLILTFLAIVYFNKANEHFQANKYEIGYDNEKKEVLLENITSKVMGDKISGFKLSGNNSYITIPNMDLEYYTLSFILYLESIKNRQYIVSNGWELYIENGNLTLKNKNQKFVFPKELEAKAYTHIGIKVNKEIVTLFVDGTEIEYELKNVSSKSQMLLGSNASKNIFMVGLLGEIHLYTDIYNNKQLCDLHDACKLESCSYEADGATRDECYQNCMESSDGDCREEACTNKCYNKSTSKWTPPCGFKPYGSDIFSCMNHCVTKNNCNYKNCQKICQECDDKEVCPWINNKETVQEVPFSPEDTSKLNGEPKAPKIFLVPYNGKFLVKWTKPETYENQQGDIDEYVCFVYKSLNKADGIQMTKVPYPKCKNCEFVINDLDKDTYYSVGVRAYNSKGLSKMSNIVSMKPQYKANKKPVSSPTQAPSRPEIYSYCNATN